MSDLILRPGDIVKAFRGLYFHYGVYVGDGRVVHFSSTGDNELDAASADIVETSLEQFAKDDPVSVDMSGKTMYCREEVVRRARAAIGTKLGTYNLLSNNCEHFANWCRCGQLISRQRNLVDAIANELFPKDSVPRILKDVAIALFQEDEKKVLSFYNNNQLPK